MMPHRPGSLPLAWVCAVLALLATPAWSDEAIDRWLARMDRALQQSDYQGILIYTDSERMDTLRIYHSAAEDRERLVTLSGAHREVIREGRSVTCIGKGRPPTVYDGAGLSALAPVARAAREGRLPNYRASLGPSERAAGRAAQVLELAPADRYRYGYRLWLDQATGFPLRVVLLDAQGQSLEQIVFTEIDLGQPPAAQDLEAASSYAVRRVQLPAPVEASLEAVAVPAGLPEGFTVRSRRHDTEREDHWVFSDGLASVSVYVQPATGEISRDTASRSGAVNAHLIERNARRVYAIGKVPQDTVEHFARALIAGDRLADGG